MQYCSGGRELEGQFLSQIKGRERQQVALRIVGPTSAISTRIAQNIEPLYFKYPFLRLHLQSDDYSNRVEMIRRGEADLAIVPPELVPDEMDSKILKPDRYLLVASHKWKGRKLSEILEEERIIDFKESDQTTFNYLRNFDLNAKRERLFVNENGALIRFFIGGVGFGTLTESIASTYLESEKLIVLNRGQAFEDRLALAWYARSHKTEYFEETIRSIK